MDKFNPPYHETFFRPLVCFNPLLIYFFFTLQQNSMIKHWKQNFFIQVKLISTVKSRNFEFLIFFKYSLVKNKFGTHWILKN